MAAKAQQTSLWHKAGLRLGADIFEILKGVQQKARPFCFLACQGAGRRLKQRYFAGGVWAFEGEILKCPPVESNL